MLDELKQELPSLALIIGSFTSAFLNPDNWQSLVQLWHSLDAFKRWLKWK